MARPDPLSLVHLLHGLAGVAVRLPGSAALHSGAQLRDGKPAATRHGPWKIRHVCHGDFRRGLGYGWIDLRSDGGPHRPCENAHADGAHVLGLHRALCAFKGLGRFRHLPLHHGPGRGRRLRPCRGADCRRAAGSQPPGRARHIAGAFCGGKHHRRSDQHVGRRVGGDEGDSARLVVEDHVPDRRAAGLPLRVPPDETERA